LSLFEHTARQARLAGVKEQAEKQRYRAVVPARRPASVLPPHRSVTAMAQVSADMSEVFSAREIAGAAGVPVRLVRDLIRGGAIDALPCGFVTAATAIDAVRSLSGHRPIDTSVPRQLFAPMARQKTPVRMPLLASVAAHGGIFIALVLAAAIGASSPAVSQPLEFKPVRMVFLAIPGPGGGGGGGGLRQPAPPRKAELQGQNRMRSPVPVTRAIKSETPKPEPRSVPPAVKPAERPVDPPPPAKSPDPAPPVVAPVASVPADPVDRPGVLDERDSKTTSRGNGEGGGSGTGTGSGVGEGTGPGVGPGSGGGTGGGPYRPGSGITPPGLLHEVKPDYTEEARSRGIEGEVVLEIVVRSDGSVGNVRILRGLGAGLDQRASEAVRQWRFSPARRHGSPVDVMVEVAVEFRIR
jgi:periplasmic protein TonB